MKKAIRFFSLALAILMLVPLLSVFPVKVSATEQTYDETHDGELIRTVNFASDEWKQGFYDGNNSDAIAAVSADGTSVAFTVTSNLYKRAMWGGFYPGAGMDEDEYDEALGAVLPMETGAKYTMIFDLTLGNDNVAFGIMVDGNNALTIQGNGQSRWYGWNTVRVGNTSINDEKWHYHTAAGDSRRDIETFAVTVDYDERTMSLYVKDRDDGNFYFCRSMTYDGTGVWDSAYFRCRLAVRSISGTPDETYTAEISNLNIYKGNAMNPLFGDGYRLPYWAHADGDKLLDVNFNADEWRPAFATENNVGADIAVSDDGSAVSMTVLNESYKRAMWGGFYTDAADGSPEEIAFFDALSTALPMESGARYTAIFDLKLKNDHVSFGIQVDGRNTLSIQGNGQTRWYGWNDICVGDSAFDSERWDAHIADGSTRRDTHTFAVTVDYDAKTMSLYVLDENDGAFYLCRSIYFSDANVWNSACFRCRLSVRSIGGSPNANYKADLANLKLYKGDVLNYLWNDVYTLPYGARESGDKLLKVNFNADGWKREFATTSNVGALITPSSDGSSLSMTVLNESYKRAIWGGFYPGAGVDEDEFDAALGTALPMCPGAKYTLVFNLTLGDDHVAFGVQVDGHNTLSIQGNGQTRWYGWNDLCVDATSDANEKWNYHTAEGSTRRDMHTFAVTIDYDRKTMALYVLDETDGEFYFCRSMTYDGSMVWNSAYFRCRLNVRSIGGTPNANYTAELSDLTIYKGIDLGVADMSVMNYNIEMYDHGTNGGWDGRDPEKVIDTILAENPDILGLQEVNQIEKKIFGITYSSVGWEDYLPTLESNGYARIAGNPASHRPELLYKTDKFRALDSGYRTYRGDLDLAFPDVDDGGANMAQDNSGRSFAWALLQDKTSGKKILAISTHLHYRNSKTHDDPNSTDNILVRQYEIRLLLAWIDAQSFDYDGIVIVGDMNAHYLSGSGKTTIDIFKNGGYAVTRDTAEVKGDTGGTLAEQGRTIRPNWNFDYILTKGNVNATYYTVVDNKIDNGNTSYPSDHLPTLSTLTVY